MWIQIENFTTSKFLDEIMVIAIEEYSTYLGNSSWGWS